MHRFIAATVAQPGRIMRALSVRRVTAAALAVAVGATAGCTNIAYYMQSVDGQMRLLHARQDISAVITDPATPAPLKARLARVLEIREFASREMKLPDNPSYRGYADLRRPFVVWNVFAAGEFSVEPQRWCFPFAGCVGYRGYFSQQEAEAFAAEQARLGLDVFVGGVPAYSTLGWFDDPVLNTFIHYPEQELARLVFHELAHQVAYARDDSEFNESFAVAVELEGVRRWMAVHGNEKMRADFEVAQRRRAQFTGLVLRYRQKLAALYRSPLAPEELRSRKQGELRALLDDYALLKHEWRGFAGYDRFFRTVSNANIASVAIYHALVPHFQEMLARHGGDMRAFYAEVRQLARLEKTERAARLIVYAGHSS